MFDIFFKEINIETMKNKPTKIRPPRVYRTKTGRPYIKHKGKKIYLNFGKKTNDMSTLNIIKLFLKYLTKKKRSTTTRRPKSVIEKPEQENREKVNMQIEKYLSDKYGRINEMDKAEEKKRKEAKERAEEKKRGDEAQARQELKDAEERKRDIDRAIERERKLQAELKADRAVSQTVLRQLTASNDRIERLIEEGKNAARDAGRDVKERVGAIPVEDAPRRERKRVDDRGDRKRVDDLGDDQGGEEKGVEYRVIEDVTAISKAEEEREKAEKAARNAEEAKLQAERDAKVAIDNADKSIRKAKERQQRATEDAKKAEQAKQRAEEAEAEARKGVDKTVRGAAAATAAARKSKREAEDAKKAADKSKREAEDAKKAAEKSKKEAEDAKKAAEKSKKEAEDAKKAADKFKEETEAAKEESKKAREESKKSKRDGVIDAMFSAPISEKDKTKVSPTRLVEFLQLLDYNIKEVKQKGKKLNAKDTVKNFLKANPEKFDLGDTAETGWNNLLFKLTQELNAYTAAETARLEEEEEKAKKKEKTRDDSKQEVEDPTEEDDSGDGTIEEVTEQEGTGLRVLKDACVKIIGKLL